MDTLTQAQRSERMSRVRSKNTRPELIVRRLIRTLGFRFRTYGKHLPGKPDVFFPTRKLAIFVHGCFWHRHGTRCRLTRLPKSRLDYWIPKLERNRRRDIAEHRKLRKAGWRTLVIWECQLKESDKIERRLTAFLA
jgi:DNA mismatch endonuclease (patch repair protein)